MTAHSTPAILFSFLTFFFGTVFAEEETNEGGAYQTSAAFAGKMFAFVGDAHKGNIVFSPFGVQHAVGIAGLGAAGKTLEDITHTMQLQSLEKEFPTIASIYAHGKDNSNESGNELINSSPVRQKVQVLIKKGVNVDGRFLAAIAGITGTDCEELEINSKILSSFPQENWEQSQLVIKNVLKFSGRWSSPFSSVYSLPFHLDKERTVQAIFMEDREQFFDVADFGDSYGFSLGFVQAEPSHPECVMLLIVPKERDGIVEIMKGIADECLPEWIAQILDADSPKSYRLFLPRFSIDTSLELKECLSSMGMKSAFDINADFSKLSIDPPLHITNVLQTAHIDVDEYGADASAETAVLVGAMGLRRPTTIRVDRPFVYSIYDKSNHQVLFIGRCDNPVTPGTLVPSDEQPKLSEYL